MCVEIERATYQEARSSDVMPEETDEGYENVQVYNRGREGAARPRRAHIRVREQRAPVEAQQTVRDPVPSEVPQETSRIVVGGDSVDEPIDLTMED